MQPVLSALKNSSMSQRCRQASTTAENLLRRVDGQRSVQQPLDRRGAPRRTFLDDAHHVDDDAGRVVRSAALWPQQLGAPVGAHLQRGLAGVTRGVPLSRLWRQLRAARTERDFALSDHGIAAHHRLDVHHAQRHRRRSVDRQRKVPEKSAPLIDPPRPSALRSPTNTNVVVSCAITTSLACASSSAAGFTCSFRNNRYAPSNWLASSKTCGSPLSGRAANFSMIRFNRSSLCTSGSFALASSLSAPLLPPLLSVEVPFAV